MKLLFENWRKFIVEQKQKVELLGILAQAGSGDRPVYLIDGVPYYVSTGVGGKSRGGDLVQFGGIVNAWRHKPTRKLVGNRDVRAWLLNTGRPDWDPDPPPIDTSTPAGRERFKAVLAKKKKEFVRSHWVVKNPDGKTRGIIPASAANKIRDRAAEKAAERYYYTDINYLLKERGAINYDWFEKRGLGDDEIPGVRGAQPLRLEKPKLKIKRKHQYSLAKKIKRELKHLKYSSKEGISTFKELITKYGTKLPIIGRLFKILFAGTIGGLILAKCEEAYANEGVIGVVKVLGEEAVDWTPILGDFKGGLEVINVFDDAHWMKRYETEGQTCWDYNSCMKELEQAEEHERRVPNRMPADHKYVTDGPCEEGQPTIDCMKLHPWDPSLKYRVQKATQVRPELQKLLGIDG